MPTHLLLNAQIALVYRSYINYEDVLVVAANVHMRTSYIPTMNHYLNLLTSV